ncbi:MAG: hypothetical protein N2D54_02880 [Chloroflexota bacterium]
MNSAFRTTIITIGIILAVSALLVTGMAIGRSGLAGLWPGGMLNNNGFNNTVQMPHGSMMGGFGPSGQNGSTNESNGFSYMTPGMMSSGMMGGGMMDGGGGMMSGGMMSGGMMGGGMIRNYSPSLIGVEPITIERAEKAVNNYLSNNSLNDLVIGEIMIFNNHAYAQIIEESTGIGAMEVLIDPVNFSVYPEFGPNMMWNQKYGMMSGNSGSGMMGGMMNGFQQVDPSPEMTLAVEDAVKKAQQYLDENIPGAKSDDHADQFYGYYTLHIEKDGEIIGMLSVNGYSGDVFLHTWHGDFIEMSME